MGSEVTTRAIISVLPETFPTLEMLSERKETTIIFKSGGTNRIAPEKCQIRAGNDLEAIYCWLNQYTQSPRTCRHYQKEAERLLLWCLFQQKKPLSSLDTEDIKQYQLFLSDPQPRTFWCAPKGSKKRKRGSKEWRPFEKGLGHRSRETALTILNSLFSYLIKARYLDFNPFSLISPAKPIRKDQELQQIEVRERTLASDEWQALLETIEMMPENTDSTRQEKLHLKYLVYLLFFLGLRISEVEQSTWQAFREIDGKWWFFVVGKGGHYGKVPVHNQLLDCIRVYRLSQSLAPLPQQNDIDRCKPILCNSKTQKPFTSRYLNYQLKQLAVTAAKRFTDQPNKAAKLKKFSAHWLRHLSASMQDQAGIAFKHIRANHRHINDATTRLYVHAFDNERHVDMQKLQLNLSNTGDQL